MFIVWALQINQATRLGFELVVPLGGFPALFWPVLLVGVVGLADDMGVEVKPLIRLSVMLVTELVFLLLNPEALPNRLLEVLNLIGSLATLALTAASSIFLAGFVNAANISDRANGL